MDGTAPSADAGRGGGASGGKDYGPEKNAHNLRMGEGLHFDGLRGTGGQLVDNLLDSAPAVTA